MTEGTGTRSGRFWRRRECWVPTWRTCVLAGLTTLLAALALVLGVYPYLASTRLLPTDTLVVEGWCDDLILETALAEFHRGKYSRILVTGGLLEQGSSLSEYRTFADLGAATLRKLAPAGVPIIAVPAPRADRDRTYNTAVALRRWLHSQGPPPRAINLVTCGPHARRSRLLFAKALEPETSVGVLSVPDQGYDADRWWLTSMGFRTVTGEVLAYAYVATAFRPAPLSTAPSAP